MDATRARRAARLAQIDDHLAMERRHVADVTAQLEKARALGWARGIDQARALLDLGEERIALLTRQRGDLVIGSGGEPDQNSN
jgi:hypothetical protein